MTIVAWSPTVEDRSCINYTGSGNEYEELHCVYPWMENLYFGWEFTWRPVYMLNFIDEHVWFPVGCVVFYLTAIYLGKKYFENRPAWNLKKQMAAWNLMLSIFSFFGFIRTFPLIVHNWMNFGFFGLLCNDTENSLGWTASSWWIVFMVWSKVFELVDTFFIVAQKKKLILLHWYHHATVLLCSWHTIVSRSPAGVIYTSMNYGVHAVMYLYYFLMAVKMKPNWFKPQWVTIVQLAQMVVGVIVSICAFTVVYEDECWAGFENNAGILVMYTSYFLLFSQFFLNRFGLGIDVSGGNMNKKNDKSSDVVKPKIKAV